MKIDSGACKEFIVDFCNRNRTKVVSQYVPQGTQQEIDRDIYFPTLKASNWKRISKRRDWTMGTIERIFNCVPLDDTLRATVVTDDTDTTVLELRVEGE